MNTAYGSMVKWRRSSHSGDTGGQCVEIALVPPSWRKSSHSDDTGAQCVEIARMVPVSATDWRKSSKSDSSGGACVEVADLAAAVAMRDSKDPDGPKLVFTPDAWQAFANHVKRGNLDLS